MATFGLCGSSEGGRRPGRASAHGLSAQLGRGEGHAGAVTSRRRGSANGAGGHYRPCQGKLAGACGSCEAGECRQVARQGGEREEGCLPRRPSTAAPWPTVARREKALPGLNSRHKREHQVPESEAELLALDCWPRWRRGGEFDRQVRWHDEGESERARRGRRRKAARESVGERSGSSRIRRARGSGHRPAATRGGVDGA